MRVILWAESRLAGMTTPWRGSISKGRISNDCTPCPDFYHQHGGAVGLHAARLVEEGISQAVSHQGRRLTVERGRYSSGWSTCGWCPQIKSAPASARECARALWEGVGCPGTRCPSAAKRSPHQRIGLPGPRPAGQASLQRGLTSSKASMASCTPFISRITGSIPGVIPARPAVSRMFSVDPAPFRAVIRWLLARASRSMPAAVRACTPSAGAHRL